MKQILTLLACAVAVWGQTQILWSEDFATNPFTNGWTTSGTGSSGGTLTPSQCWTRDLDGPSGYYSQTSEIIASTTVANGFLMMDADYLNGFGGPPGGVEEFHVEAVSPVINLSSNPSVQLRFEHKYRFCCMNSDPHFWVDISTDGFNNIAQSYSVQYADANVNQVSGTRTVVLNISNAITGNPANVQVRFRWGAPGSSNNASHYYWQIDDVQIMVPPAHDLMHLSYTNNYVNTGYEAVIGAKDRYTITPLDQVNPVQAYGQALNIGANAESQCAVHAKWKNSSNSIVTNEQGVGTSLFPGDTLRDTTSAWVNPAISGIGDYYVVNEVRYTNFAMDDNLLDNYSDTTRYTISSYEWAKERVHELANGASLPNYDTEHMFGNMFTPITATSMNFVKFSINSNTDVGATPYIYPVIYEVDEAQLQATGDPNDFMIEIYNGDQAGNYMIIDNASQINTPTTIRWQYFQLPNIPMLPGKSYFVGINGYFQNNQDFYMMGDSKYSYTGAGYTYLPSNGGWTYYAEGSPRPAIRILTDQIVTTNLSVTNPISCEGICDGSVAANPSPTGAMSLSYQWMDDQMNIVAAPGSLTADNLCAGTYLFQSYNLAENFETFDTIVLTDPSPLSGIVVGNNETCPGLNNGWLEVSATGGTPPYTYSWSNTATTDSIYGLAPGPYDVTVTDANGCFVYYGGNIIGTNGYDAQLAFTANPTAGTAPLSSIFDNQTPNLTNYNFTWVWGDGQTEPNNNSFVTHNYTAAGLWTVTLMSEDISTGCKDTLIKTDYVYTTGGAPCSHTASISAVGNLTGCAGDSTYLVANSVANATYQWFLDGSPILGATDTFVYVTQSGSYHVNITESGCTETSNAIVSNINPAPVPTISATGSINGCIGGSVQLDANAGYSAYLWSTSAGTSSITVTQSGDYWVTVVDGNGCQGTSAVYTVNASNQTVPEICVVGLDSATNFNRIVWEKPISTGIDSFYVYKETNQANVYAKIGATDYADLGLWIDPISNPAQQAYRYKISLLDTCGVESGMGDLHKSIHLTINQGVGQTWNLIWSHYEGISFASYNIYRGTNTSNMTLLTTVASNLNSYTDLLPPGGTVYYQIEVVHPTGCNPTKAGYDFSRSNIADNGVVSIAEYNNDVRIYPNPTNDIVNIVKPGAYAYKLYDSRGKLISEGNAFGETKLSLRDLTTGIYYVHIEGQSFKLVKN